MLFALLRAATGFCCCLITAAGAQIPAASSGAIGGIVVDANSNAPVRRAIITLSTLEALPQDAVAWTDANGRFSFGYLPAGRYQLRASKDGYQGAAYGTETPRHLPAIIQLAAGESRSDFTFRLHLMSSISGVVLGDDGDPLAGVQVTAMTAGFQRGKRRLFPGPGVLTDSNGRYRLSGLTPGRYVVVATPMYRPALRVNPEVAAGQAQQQYSYGIQYYLEADRAESAAPLALQSGQEISRIDFRLAARPTTSLQGKIVLPAGVTAVEDASISVMSENPANRIRMSASPYLPDFTFRFDQFMAGSYLLVAEASVDGRRYRGAQFIEVPPQGLRDAAIPVEPSIDLAGSVAAEGPGAEKYSASFVGLVPGDDLPWNRQPLRTSVNKDGSFKIAGVPPGVWDINAGPIPPGGYLKSMRLGDQDVLTEDMVIRSSTTARLKIVIGTQAAALQGDVVKWDQPARAVVLLAPDGKFRHVLSFYRVVTADEKGHFELKNATPGSYKLYAFEEFDQRSIQNPEFLKPFESAGVPVTLREGENAAQKLAIIAVDPGSQSVPVPGAHQ